MDYENLPSNIYYDANIINSDQSGIKPPPRLVFQDIRSLPIISIISRPFQFTNRKLTASIHTKYTN